MRKIIDEGDIIIAKGIVYDPEIKGFYHICGDDYDDFQYLYPGHKECPGCRAKIPPEIRMMIRLKGR